MVQLLLQFLVLPLNGTAHGCTQVWVGWSKLFAFHQNQIIILHFYKAQPRIQNTSLRPHQLLQDTSCKSLGCSLSRVLTHREKDLRRNAEFQKATSSSDDDLSTGSLWAEGIYINYHHLLLLQLDARVWITWEVSPETDKMKFDQINRGQAFHLQYTV